MTRICKIEDITKNNITVKKEETPIYYGLFGLLGELLKPVEKKIAKKAPESKVGSFLVKVDSLELAQQLIWTAVELGLTVAGGDQYGMKTKYPVRDIQCGDYLEFFGNHLYDIDWTNSEEWALSMDYRNAKVLSVNFFGILKTIQEVAKEKKQLLKKGKWPTQPTYYTLKQEAISYEKRTSSAREEEKKSYSSVASTTTIRDLGFAVEVNGKIYSKNLKDSIYYVL